MSSQSEATHVPVYREFLGKLRRDKNISYRDLAVKMGTPEYLLEDRVKQLQHFFNDSKNPNAGFAKAVERALDDGDGKHPLSLPPEDYGWDPSKL